jgi:chemotaxis protein methyltransferase CheR
VHPFDALRDVVLPEIVAARQCERRIRIWCAASSSGQEPYTIAMVLREHFAHLDGWDLSVVATDISREMLDRAKTGRYSGLEVNRGLPARFLVKYFRKDGTSYEIDERVKSLVEYRELNLAKPFPLMGPFDIVFMRNVLIYFDTETKRQILTSTRRVLAPDGYLFLGGAETTINIDDAWLRIPQGQTSCYRLRP